APEDWAGTRSSSIFRGGRHYSGWVAGGLGAPLLRRWRRREFPAPVHPEPLLGVAKHQDLQHRVVGAGVAPDFLADFVAFDQRERLFEAQHVRAVGLPPAGRRHDRRARRERHDREALERSRRFTEELDRDAVGRRRVLIEWEDDDVARFEALENRVERPALAQDAEAALAETPVDQRVEPARPDRAADEMEAAAHMGKMAQARDRRDVEIAEVAGTAPRAFYTRAPAPPQLDTVH